MGGGVGTLVGTWVSGDSIREERPLPGLELGMEGQRLVSTRTERTHSWLGQEGEAGRTRQSGSAMPGLADKDFLRLLI